MSLTTDSMSAADLAAITGNGRNNGFGYGDGFLYWIIILFFFGMFNGNNGWGGNGNGGANGLYPWMNQSNQMNDGFRDQMLNTQLNGIQNGIISGFGDMQTALCGGFAGVNAGIAAAQNSIAQQMYANQIADLQQSFASQTATAQGFNGMQSQLAQCCCDNRMATVQTQNTVQNEGAQTRLAIQNQTQAILDKLCQLELDGLKQDNANLRTQLNMANLAASQTAQTAELRQNNATVANQLISELRSCPIPSQPVYGNSPIFSCGNNGYSGCGCGA